MYCVIGFTVRCLLILVLLILRKLTDLMRKWYQKLLKLEVDDHRFDLVCSCHLLEDTPVCQANRTLTYCNNNVIIIDVIILVFEANDVRLRTSEAPARSVGKDAFTQVDFPESLVGMAAYKTWQPPNGPHKRGPLYSKMIHVPCAVHSLHYRTSEEVCEQFSNTYRYNCIECQQFV